MWVSRTLEIKVGVIDMCWNIKKRSNVVKNAYLYFATNPLLILPESSYLELLIQWHHGPIEKLVGKSMTY